ncbi:MAG: bifunctional UDP-N-acetylmuramoyl-tripeptide:D-alanyl-D-alanine ligase/alanine racemase [Bacteroidales bacterium]|nr:bifunctional UDP-N-acetylmuramoyl-tripeptide:D-alanyl-D-alanine ligase/alanine racemase [Bacteroidales bacterium]
MFNYYNISKIVKIINGELIKKSGKNNIINYIIIDSRRLFFAKNSIFFALISKRNNGHKYIDELYKNGLRNFVVSSAPDNIDKYIDSNFILVKDTLEALQSLGQWHRKKFNIPVIGITGSNGKTIIKEWLYQLMCFDKNIIRSPKSYNSQIGVPLSVWQMCPDNDIAVFEAGISMPGEMQKLQKIILPDIGIFTNIGHAHDVNFNSLSQKINEKLKLFSNVKTIIYCSDHKEINSIISENIEFKNKKIFSWGKSPNSELIIKKIIKNDNSTLIKASYKLKEIDINIPFIDNASIENAIHCWALMLLLGYDNDIIDKRMKLLTPIAMRLELKDGINNCSLINDYYNSDINSISIALDFLDQQNQHVKKTIIISDVLQSTRNDDVLYADIANLLLKKNVKKIIGIGKAIKKQSDKFKIEKYFFESTEEFLNKMSLSSFNNETILLKGARHFKFERISRLLQKKTHETVLEINLDSLIHNLNFYKSAISHKTKIMAMVKAFSYGSGSFEIANILQFYHIDYLCVAYADEGVDLRKSGITVPIMVMNPETDSMDSIIKYNLEPEIYNFRILKLLNDSIKKNLLPETKGVKIHLKLDTGMHRLGFEKHQLKELVSLLKNSKHIYVQSIFSHLVGSDDKNLDDFTKHQIDLFKEMTDYLLPHFNHKVLLHILNSAGITRFPEAQFDMVRLGIGLYGISPFKEVQNKLIKVSTLKTVISQIKFLNANESIGYNRNYIAKKNMKIAVLPVGYADGLKRSLSKTGFHFLINNKFAYIVGNICMDMCMVDITDIDAKEGDEVIVFGKENQSINYMADKLESIPYEVLTNISRRVKRIYFQE